VSAEEAERYLLPADPMHDFNYLNQSGCSSIEGVDDATDFATLKAAMTAVGINHQQQTEVFEVLAGILWLGNIQFRAPTEGHLCRHALNCCLQSGSPIIIYLFQLHMSYSCIKIRHAN